MWDRIREWADNPILVKHIRTRLRPQALFTWLAIVALIGLLVAYAGFELDIFKTGGAAGWLIAIQVVLLGVIGSSQVNASVNGARASGILDFHRVTPMTPTELTLGFFFGAPIREYVLFAAVLPFLVLCMAMGVPSFRGFLQLMIFMITSSWVIHSMMLLNGLVSKAKNPTGGAVGVVVFVIFFFAWIFAGSQFSVNAVENDHRLGFFGMSLPWLPVALLYQLPVLFFMLLAATRKMESQRLHPLSKPQTLAAMLTFALLTVGGVWQKDGYEVYQTAALYSLAIPAILLVMMTTPSQAEYTKGLYRAQKQGKTRLPWWDDLSVSAISLVLLCGIVLAAGTVVGTIARGEPDRFIRERDATAFGLALACAVLTVAYFGTALQYFQLRFARRGTTFFALFLFIAWILPVLAGAIQSFAMGPMWSRAAGYPFFAISPAGGIGMIFLVNDPGAMDSVRFSAITPALLFTFLFNSLLIGARRRVMKNVFGEIARKQQAVELEIAEPVS